MRGISLREPWCSGVEEEILCLVLPSGCRGLVSVGRSFASWRVNEIKEEIYSCTGECSRSSVVRYKSVQDLSACSLFPRVVCVIGLWILDALACWLGIL